MDTSSQLSLPLSGVPRRYGADGWERPKERRAMDLQIWSRDGYVITRTIRGWFSLHAPNGERLTRERHGDWHGLHRAKEAANAHRAGALPAPLPVRLRVLRDYELGDDGFTVAIPVGLVQRGHALTRA